MNELKFAVRRLLKQPGFTATALLTLALCLGANLTIFAVVDSVLMRPLPFPAPQELVTIYNSYPKAGLDRDGASVRNYFTRRGHIDALASVAALRYGSELIGGAGATERREVVFVTPEFFATLGVTPAMGRAFTEQEMTPQSDNTVVLTDTYWRQRYNAAPDILGRPIGVGGVQKTIVGVLPPGFRYLSSNAQIFLPLASNEEMRAINALHVGGVEMIGRLKPGATLAQAQAQTEADNAMQSRDFPWADQVAATGFFVTVAPLHADHVAAIRPTLLLLQAGVLCLLLIGGVNLINLLLIRASARTKEMGVRQALGAGRKHVLRQVLGETLVLTVSGAVLGLFAGAGGIRALSLLGADKLPLVADVAVNARLVWVALLGAVIMGAIIAAPVVWFTVRRPLASALQSEARGGTSSHATQNLRHAFIVAQIALAFVLLAGAGLLGVSLRQAMAVAPGFRADNVLTGRLALSEKNYAGDDARVIFVERLLDRVGHQPGVLAAAISSNIPVRGKDADNDNNVMTVIGYTPEPGVSPVLHYRYGVAGDYFAAMAIPLRAGRFLGTEDSHGGRRVCVVDEDFARHYWPDGNALGRRLFEGPDARPDDQAFTVVGVVGAVKQTELTAARGNGAIYFPFKYFTTEAVYVVTRTGQTPASLAPTLRSLVREIDPELAFDNLKPMDARIADTLVARRSPALLAGMFAAVALLLAAIGTYGVLSYAVSQRRREVGMRMALGAQPRQIRGQFLALGLRLLAAGSVLGVFGAWLAGLAMQGFLFDVPALHFATLFGTAAVMSAVSLTACLLPSQRAARISPMAVLSEE